ncbi:MAG: hypothetical protein Ta2B_21840 [Termitinemataceae bacterium]|nr:MAG: hypothetical protein Ta2B_21840 [Termitinemataceae bacterium]
MSILGVVLLVVFIIVAILLVLLVLVQNEEGDSLGGVFAGGSSSAFGSRSGNILTKATTVLGALFLVISFSLALINRSPNADKGVESEGRKGSAEKTSQWYLENGTDSYQDESGATVFPGQPGQGDAAPQESGEIPSDGGNGAD